MSIFVKMAWQWILFDLFSSFNFFNFDVTWDLWKCWENNIKIPLWLYLDFSMLVSTFSFISLSLSFLLCSPSAPFLPEYANSFWIKLKIWWSFTFRTLLGISLQNQSSVKFLSDFSSRWYLIAVLKDPMERLPNWIFFWLMSQSHKQNEVYIFFLQLLNFAFS